MRLTSDWLLLILAFVGDDGLTVADLSKRLGTSQNHANFRLRRMEKRGWVVRAGIKARRPGEHGKPAQIWKLAAPLAPHPAKETTLSA